MTKIGEVPYFGQFFFHLKAPGKILTGDHQNTVDPCYGQYELAGGLPPTPHPYFGQFIASPPPLSPVMVNILPPVFINPCYGQFIINWWLWRHYSALFTICRPVMVNLSSLGFSNAIIQQRVYLSTLILPIYHQCA